MHEGFRDGLLSIWPDLKKVLCRLDPAGRATWFTGHSMGAAIATLALDLAPAAGGLYSIGSPVVPPRSTSPLSLRTMRLYLTLVVTALDACMTIRKRDGKIHVNPACVARVSGK